MFKRLLTFLGNLLLWPIALLLFLIYLLFKKLGWVPSYFQFRLDIDQAQSAFARYLQHSDPTDLDDSITAWQRILQHPDFATVDAEFRLVVLNDSAGTYLRRYWARGELSDLDQALSAWQTIVTTTPPESPYLPGYLNNLGTGLRDRYARTGDLTDLQAGLEAYQRAVQLTPAGAPDLPGILNNLGIGFSSRYARTGDLTDLQARLEAYQRAVQLTPAGAPNLPSYLNNQGTGFQDRYARTGDLTDLQAGIEAYQRAVQLTPADAPDLPGYLNNLGGGLRDRYAHTGDLTDLTDLQAGIEASQRAVQLTPADAPDLPMFLNNLGNGFSNRYAYTGDLTDLQAGIEAYQRAVQLTPAGAPDLPMFLNDLGTGFQDRYARTGDLTDLQAGMEAFQRAAQRGLEVALEVSLTSARNWLYWAFGREAWEEVGTAYQFAYQASTSLVQTQLLRADQESWLKEFRGLAAHAAYAYAKRQQWEEAVVTLERGLAQLLGQTLARDRAELDNLTHTMEGKLLYDRYQQTLQAWREAQMQNNPSPDELRSYRTAFEQVLEAIRQVPGYETFLQAPTWEDIQVAALETQLVYIAVTQAGGVALIVGGHSLDEDEKLSFLKKLSFFITPVWLPDLTEAALQQQLSAESESDDLPQGYLRAYLDRRYFQKDDDAAETEKVQQALEQQWQASLAATTHWLWQTVIAPLIPHLPTHAKLTFLPLGRLALLPLHVAWTEDVTRPTGKLYALDHFQITYAPNARTLTAARQVAQRLTQLDQLLAIEEPWPVNASPLPNAPYETATVKATFSQTTILKHEQATVANVTAALPHCQVWHCSCHGFADMKTPLNSSLVMAHNERLTLAEILKLRLPGLRLATLSACETQIPGMALPEEIVNFPAGLLQAGAAGVLASLWSVNELSTMMLMAYFYDQWRTQYPNEPAEAFRQAQIWVRDTTNKEKVEYLEQFDQEVFATSTVKMAQPTARKLTSAVLNLKETERSFAHPYYWGAFGWTGV